MTSAPRRSTNWFLLLQRRVHAWVGVLALALLVLIALTGVYLNHTSLFQLDAVPADVGVLLTTATPAEAAPIPLARALAVAQGAWGEVPLQFVQLRQEGDRLVYRVRRRGGGDEVTVDARTGRLLAVRQAGWETRYAEDGTPGTSRPNWSRLFFDLHTGRILGEPGKWVADAGGLALLLLGSSGVYLFAIPRWRKWHTTRHPSCVGHAVAPEEKSLR